MQSTFLACVAVLGALAAPAASPADASLRLTARTRAVQEQSGNRIRVVYTDVAWDPRTTALIICDMWDQHWCKGATARVAELAPRMNAVVAKARAAGVLIIHAPSGTVDAYGNHPARQRALAAPAAPGMPKEMGAWCTKIPSEAGAAWPIDQSDGGCDCEPKCTTGNPWRGQTAALEIHDGDAITDSGAEVWNLLQAGRREHVLVMGVHTNMCVLGRPFGLRALVAAGKKAVLVRDMTDTMYNSRARPQVNHFSGTDLVLEYIETYVCPTVTSDALVGGAPFRFAGDRRPRVVVLSAENEYGAAESFPAFARHLVLTGGVAVEILQAATDLAAPDAHHIPGMQALASADAAILFARRRALPPEELRLLKEYLGRGKPLIALRTSSHAFAARGAVKEGLAQWPEFDREVLGCTYAGHAAGGQELRIASASHPILEGLQGPYRENETLYQSAPLAPSCTVLLTGSLVPAAGAAATKEPVPDEPVAWTNTYGGAKIFYTSLGSGTASFTKPWFRRMLVNAVFWALGSPAPEAAKLVAQ